MTKSDIVKEITKRVGDPNAVAYGTDVWNYFLEAVYELFPSLNDNEKRYLTTKIQSYANTTSTGTAYISQTTMGQWNDLYGVNIDGIPARFIDRDEYYKVKVNNLYVPSGDESFYLFDADKMIILTARYSTTVQLEIYYLSDPQTLWSGAADTTTINANASLIYKAIPIATEKLRQQIGLGM